jgi:hypothetical protein
MNVDHLKDEIIKNLLKAQSQKDDEDFRAYLDLATTQAQKVVDYQRRYSKNG